MLTGVTIPDDLITYILSLLPPKSLGRFKCVSKPFKTLISSPNFIQTHLQSYSNNHPQSLIFAPLFKPLVVVDFTDDHFTTTSGTTSVSNPEVVPVGWLAVCGSCNGLVLALTVTYELCLLNPTTLEFKILSFPDCDTVGVVPPNGVYGFGYDDVNCDYKVVVFCRDFIWVYSLRNGCWRMVEGEGWYWLGSRALSSDVGDSGFFVNGAIHLLRKKNFDSPRVIVAFDLSNERFREVTKPRELIDGSQIQIGLEVRVLGGCLCLTNSTTDIWVMREYGVKESWSKFSVYQPRSYHIRPVLLSGDEDFLLIMNRDKLVVYNVKENTSRDVECHGLLIKRNFEVRTFVSSLVSPKQWE